MRFNVKIIEFYRLSQLDIWGCTHCNIFLTISDMKNSMLSFDFCKVLNLTHFRSFFTGQSNIPKNARLFIMGSLIGCHGNGLSNCSKRLKNTTKLAIFLKSGNFFDEVEVFYYFQCYSHYPENRYLCFITQIKEKFLPEVEGNSTLLYSKTDL